MKNQFIYLLFLISLSTCEITLNAVKAGSCSNSVYTFTITGTTDANIDASTATVTLSSPSNVTPTCNIAKATITPAGDDTPGGDDTPVTPGGDTPVTPGGDGDDGDGDGDDARRRLADTATATITCTISSALSSATITVKEVKIGGTAATLSPTTLTMSGTATCPTSSSGDTTNNDDDEDSGKFTFVNPYIMLLFTFLF